MTKVKICAITKLKCIHYYTTVQLQIAASNAVFSDIIESKEKVHYSSKGLCVVTTATIIFNLIQVALLMVAFLMVALLMEEEMVKKEMEEEVKEEEEMVQEMEEKEETKLMDHVKHQLKV